MKKPLYESLYVIAGKREDGTFGIFINGPLDTVDCYDAPEQAEKERVKMRSVCETVVVDIGLLVDKNIPREGNTLDASVRIQRYIQRY